VCRIIPHISANVNRFEFDEAGAPDTGTPALCLFFITAAKQVSEAARTHAGVIMASFLHLRQHRTEIVLKMRRQIFRQIV